MSNEFKSLPPISEFSGYDCMISVQSTLCTLTNILVPCTVYSVYPTQRAISVHCMELCTVMYCTVNRVDYEGLWLAYLRKYILMNLSWAVADI